MVNDTTVTAKMGIIGLINLIINHNLDFHIFEFSIV